MGVKIYSTKNLQKVLDDGTAYDLFAVKQRIKHKKLIEKVKKDIGIDLYEVPELTITEKYWELEEITMDLIYILLMEREKTNDVVDSIIIDSKANIKACNKLRRK
jgi:hypothetical protein